MFMHFYIYEKKQKLKKFMNNGFKNVTFKF